jgi:hypothetical protein
MILQILMIEEGRQSGLANKENVLAKLGLK